MSKKPLTVVQVLPALNGGGVEKGTLEIAQALVAAGHHSIVISKGGRLVDQLEQQGSQHLNWDLGRKSLLTFLQIPRLRHWMRGVGADIIHVRSRMPAWMIYLAWKSLPAAERPHLVSTVHGLHSVNRYSAIMNCGEKVIVVSETLRQYQIDHYGVTAEKLCLIYRGIDENYFNFGFQPEQTWLNQWLQDFPTLHNKTVITLPGRITRLKGHKAFIELIAQLRQQSLDVAGLIVGEADAKHQSYLQELKQAITKQQLDDQIIFTGHRGDMREIFSQSDLVLSLSNKPESFGRTTLEALSLGVPVVGYDHGGVGEILAALFPAGATPLHNAAQLIKTVVQVLQEKPPIKRNQQFLLRNMQQQTLSLYQELAGDL